MLEPSTRAYCEELTEGVRGRYGFGLAYAKVASDGWQGPIGRHMGDAERTRAVAQVTFEHQYVNVGYDYIDAKDQT